MRTWNGFPAAGRATLGLLALVAATACDPGPDGGQTAASSAAESVRTADDSAGMTPEEEATDGARSDSPPPRPGRDSPSVRSSDGPDVDTVSEPPSPRSRYFVRLTTDADPVAVAERHDVEPLEVVENPVPAFYAALDSAQAAALRRDSLVTSLAREIHQDDTLQRPPVRGRVPPSESAGG